MASGSSSSSMFFGAIAADHVDLMMNSQQDSNFVLPTSLTPAQLHHHLVAPAPMNQTIIHGPSYPDAEVVVIAVSPNTLLADGNRFICDICYKGFPRAQNLQLHGRVHNLPFKLKTRTRRGVVPRKVYICPEPTCVHNHRSHALGDFGGLKKHYLRKHSNQKKYECNTCSKKYAVETDLKAHLKTCGKKKYNCSCGAPFSRHSHFAFHQAFCDVKEHEDAAKHPPTSGVGNSSEGSTSNNNSSSQIGSTRSNLPTFDMGDSSNNGSSSNNNSSSVIGSTTPHLGPQISYTQSPFNSYPFIAPNQSPLSHFGTDHESLITADPPLGLNMRENTPALFSPSSTQQNQFQRNFDIGFYTNLLMNNNVDLNDITFMGEGGIFGSEEAGSNTFSGRGIMLDHSSSLHSTSGVHNAILRQQLSAPRQLVLNEHLLGFTSRNNHPSNMVQGSMSSSSSGVGGFIIPQEDSVHGSNYFGRNNIGYNTIRNDNCVGSSIFNQDVGTGSYMQWGYYGFGDGNSHHDLY